MGETENQNIVVVGGRERTEVDQEAIIVAGTPVGTANLNTGSRSIRKIQWEDEMKTVLIVCYTEARRGNRVGFMQRMKELWDERMPEYSYISKGVLASNARRFSIGVVNIVTQSPKFKWDVKLKVQLVKLLQEEKRNGRGYMDRLHVKWCEEQPKLNWMSKQLLRDNASRFEKEEEIRQMLIVQDRQKNNEEFEFNDEIVQELFGESFDEGLWFEGFSDVSSVVINSDEENDVEEEIVGEIALEGDDETVHMIAARNSSTPNNEVGDDENEARLLNKELLQEAERKYDELREMETVDRPKLKKIRLDKKQILDMNRLLKYKLRDGMLLREIGDHVYATGYAANRIWGEKEREVGTASKGGCNRKERKLKEKIKRSKRTASIVANEMQRRREGRIATKKEKQNVIEVQEKQETEIDRKRTLTNAELMVIKTNATDAVKVDQVRLQEWRRKSRRVRNNAIFNKSESGFYRGLDKTPKTGTPPAIEKFEEFWAGIWEEEEVIKKTRWMEEIEERFRGKANLGREMEITTEDIGRMVKKRKNWSSPGVDGIQNYWWKKLDASWPALASVFQKMIDEPEVSVDGWLVMGRTVLIPKDEDLSKEDQYRPITCLNTVYKILTGLIGKYMKIHAEENELWDPRQLGTQSDVLGTIDHILVDKCVLEEIKDHKRSAALCFYDYRKAYDMVPHEWMDMVFKWMKFHPKVLKLMERLRGGWKTRLEVYNNGKVQMSRVIRFKRGFLQGDSWSPVGFCLTEVPLSMMLEKTKGYMMGEPGQRNVKLTHNLFIDDLKTYQNSHQTQSMVNEVLVKLSVDTGACYGVKKCAEASYIRGVLTKGESLIINEEAVKSMDVKDLYKFLGFEEGNGLAERTVRKRVMKELEKRVGELVEHELNDCNLVKALNTRALPVVSYVMNICHFGEGDLNELDQIVKRKLREKRMLGRQGSDERLYMRRENGGRGLKSFKDIYIETKTRVALYLHKSAKTHLQVVKKREIKKEFNSIFREVEKRLGELGINIKFEEDKIEVDGEEVLEHWKVMWRKLKDVIKLKLKVEKEEKYKAKLLQSHNWKNQDAKAHRWLKRDMMPEKVSDVMEMMEQNIETKMRILGSGREVDDVKCRVCGKNNETVQHWLTGCTPLAATEYTLRHDKALMVLAVEWAKQEGVLAKETKWYEVTWNRGAIIEKGNRRIRWDYEFRTRKPTTHRRPDLVLEYIDKKVMLIIDMACPQDAGVEEKEAEKRNKYQQLAFELRTQNQGWNIHVWPAVIGCFGNVNRLDELVEEIINERRVNWTLAEMQRVVVTMSEGIVRKIRSKLIVS